MLITKEAKFLISRQLTNSFNKFLKSGNYPDILKIAKFVPLLKGKSKLDLNNYRPISILSSINKVFETILNRRLIKFWEKYTLLYDSPFGFRKKHLTNYAATHLYEFLLRQNDCSNRFAVVFCILSETFDYVNHQILLKKTRTLRCTRNGSRFT